MTQSKLNNFLQDLKKLLSKVSMFANCKVFIFSNIIYNVRLSVVSSAYYITLHPALAAELDGSTDRLECGVALLDQTKVKTQIYFYKIFFYYFPKFPYYLQNPKFFYFQK